MPHTLIRRMLEAYTNLGQVQQMILLSTYDHSRPSIGEQISQGSGIAVQTIKSHEDMGERKRERRGVLRNHGSCATQFASIVPIACPTKGSQPLMGMGL